MLVVGREKSSSSDEMGLAYSVELTPSISSSSWSSHLLLQNLDKLSYFHSCVANFKKNMHQVLLAFKLKRSHGREYQCVTLSRKG